MISIISLLASFYWGEALGGFWPGAYTLLSWYFLLCMALPWLDLDKWVELVLTPQTTSVILPVLLLVFPIWVTLTVCSYLIAESRQVVIGLVVIAALGFGLIALLRLTGLTVV